MQWITLSVVIYLLAWIASSRTAAPRNDLFAMVSMLMTKINAASRHCELAKQSSSKEVTLCDGMFRLPVVYLFAGRVL